MLIVLSSRTFQFLVGPDTPDRKPLTIHTAVMEAHSAPLAALMNEGMSEATDEIAILEDIDEQTFVRFCEFAYIGDYTPAQRPVSAASNPAQEYRGYSDAKRYKKRKAVIVDAGLLCGMRS